MALVNVQIAHPIVIDEVLRVPGDVVTVDSVLAQRLVTAAYATYTASDATYFDRMLDAPRMTVLMPQAYTATLTPDITPVGDFTPFTPGAVSGAPTEPPLLVSGTTPDGVIGMKVQRPGLYMVKVDAAYTGTIGVGETLSVHFYVRTFDEADAVFYSDGYQIDLTPGAQAKSSPERVLRFLPEGWLTVGGASSGGSAVPHVPAAASVFNATVTIDPLLIL